MKIFVVALCIAGGYYWLMTATTDLALTQLKTMNNQYSQAITSADAMTNSATTTQH